MENIMAKRGPKPKAPEHRSEVVNVSAVNTIITRPAKPKIRPSEHLAMCGQATADNHEGRLRDLEEAVAYLLEQ